MLLSQLFPDIDVPTIKISDLCHDSRLTTPGSAFLAYKGAESNGHDYVSEAISKGAVAIIAEEPRKRDATLPWIQIPNLIARRSEIAARFFGHPSKSMQCIGITGTNGKTSVAWGLASTLGDTIFMGSLGRGFLDKLEDETLTTSDPVVIQRSMRHGLDAGATRVAMEVSSHALAQNRVENVDFDVAVFTNLTQDHLDYHGDMTRYADAKSRLFDYPALKRIVVNSDDPFGQALIKRKSRNDVEVISYGDRNADITWDRSLSESSSDAWLFHTPWGCQSMRLPIAADFELNNCAAILGVLSFYLPDQEAIHEAIKNLQKPPGRLQVFTHPNRPKVIVDYAHTPDALNRVLLALKRTTLGELVCVFGCGGNRDKSKRQLMGACAASIADRLYITSDNPRNEDPACIIHDVLVGIPRATRAISMLDRRNAIEAAILESKPDDCVVIAGKGAERYQIFGGQRIPFNDAEVAESLLRNAS